MTNFFKSRQKGLVLIEMIFYIFLLTLTLFAVTNALFSLGRSFRTLENTVAIEASAQVGLERMTRDIRNSVSIDAVSLLDVSPGKLVLEKYDSDGNLVTIEFSLVDEKIHVFESGIDTGPLVPDSVRVTNFVFRKIDTTRSSAVKIEMSVESGQGDQIKSKLFYSTIVLRGSYLP